MYRRLKAGKAFRKALEASKKFKKHTRLGKIWDSKDLGKIQENLACILHGGLANYSLQTKSSTLPVFTKWKNAVMPICLCVIHGHLCTTMAELSSCKNDHIATKPNIFAL